MNKKHLKRINTNTYESQAASKIIWLKPSSENILQYKQCTITAICFPGKKETKTNKQTKKYGT